MIELYYLFKVWKLKFFWKIELVREICWVRTTLPGHLIFVKIINFLSFFAGDVEGWGPHPHLPQCHVPQQAPVPRKDGAGHWLRDRHTLHVCRKSGRCEGHWGELRSICFLLIYIEIVYFPNFLGLSRIIYIFFWIIRIISKINVS